MAGAKGEGTAKGKAVSNYYPNPDLKAKSEAERAREKADAQQRDEAGRREVARNAEVQRELERQRREETERNDEAARELQARQGVLVLAREQENKSLKHELKALHEAVKAQEKEREASKAVQEQSSHQVALARRKAALHSLYLLVVAWGGATRTPGEGRGGVTKVSLKERLIGWEDEVPNLGPARIETPTVTVTVAVSVSVTVTVRTCSCSSNGSSDCCPSISPRPSSNCQCHCKYTFG